jgi:tryptophanyl-tRNA synthetase
MAGDILLYQTDRVPIGDDQRQHLELSRDVAERFNARFGETFVLPEGIYPEVGARIMDLQEPDRKMSTTGGTLQGTVGMLDPPETIVKKFRSAVTDSGRDVVYDPEGKPGISNLIEILAVVRGVAPADVERDFADAGGYGDFKRAVGEEVAEWLAPVRTSYLELREDTAAIEEFLAAGAEKAHALAAPVVADVRDRMGVGRPSQVSVPPGA